MEPRERETERKRTEERRKLFIERVKRIWPRAPPRKEWRSARVIKGGPMGASGRGWHSSCVCVCVAAQIVWVLSGVEGREGEMVRVSPSPFKGRINKEMCL